jgi:hypothetical protein
METINIITERIKLNFDFLTTKGYAFEPIEIYNQANKDRIFAKINLKNDSLNRELTFTIYPREAIKIEIYITNCVINKSMNFKDYMEFKKGEPPKYSPPFIVDGGNLVKSVDQLFAVIKSLIETNLKDVVGNHEWITFPKYDPKEGY